MENNNTNQKTKTWVRGRKPRIPLNNRPVDPKSTGSRGGGRGYVISDMPPTPPCGERTRTAHTSPIAGNTGSSEPGSSNGSGEAGVGHPYLPRKAFRRLSGAEQRKRKNLRMQGAEPHTSPSNTQATLPVGEGKRIRSEGSTPEEIRVTHPVKRVKALSYSRAVATDLKIAVVPEGFPGTCINKNQAKLIEEAVLELIKKQAASESPRFVDNWVSHGALVVQGETGKDIEWMRTQVGNLTPWKGAKLRVMRPEDLPKRVKILIYTKAGKTAQEILAVLGKQNCNLNTKGWTILEFRPVAGKSESSTLVSMSATEAEALSRVEYSPHYGLGRARCVPIQRQKAGKEQPSDTPSSGGQTVTVKGADVPEAGNPVSTNMGDLRPMEVETAKSDGNAGGSLAPPSEPSVAGAEEDVVL